MLDLWMPYGRKPYPEEIREGVKHRGLTHKQWENKKRERKNRILESYALQYGTVADKDVILKRAQAEAVKEFAERVTELIYEADDVNPVTECQIDNLVKETVGEQRKEDENAKELS